MEMEREIIRRVRVDLDALEATLNQNKRQINEREERQLLIAAALKFGTMVAPGTMELTVSSVIGAGDNYEVAATYYPERNERVVRVRRMQDADHHY